MVLGASDVGLAKAQVDLLRAIEQSGSISKAAKLVGISYKTAWDRVDSMNNLSDKPLVARSAGGAKGGGTSLTELGEKIITGFETLQEEHARFIDSINNKMRSFSDLANFMKTGGINTSARNQFYGTITLINHGAVNAELEIDIGIDQKLVSVVTEQSLEVMQLEQGDAVIALIKASSVIISDDVNISSSARNKLCGAISQILPGAVNTDVTIDLGEGKSVSSVITNVSADNLALKTGHQACALFKAGSVILLKPSI